MPMRATTIRFSEELWQLLAQGARAEGVSTAQFIRDSVLLRLGATGDGARRRRSGAADNSEAAKAVRDPGRLAALRGSGMLDTAPTPSFDRLTRLTSRFLNAPVALVSLVDADRQFFKSCLGLPEPWASRRETPLSHSFCQHVVAGREPLIVNDARDHPELRDSLALHVLDVVAYAGVPLIDRGGHALGTVCAIDNEPRLWSNEQIDTLRDLAETAVAEIELHAARLGGG